MLNIDAKGSFCVRIQEFPLFPEIEGKILYIREVSAEGIKVSFTSDCKPAEQVYKLPPEANDNGWYNITDMIFTANAAILPRYDRCVFANDISMNYRNHLDHIPAAMTEQEARGKICLLGTPNGRTLTFSKQAYFVVDTDNQGYILAYSGYCQPLEEWEKPNLQQRVLRLVGTGRKLYPAADIVTACNMAYEEDMGKAHNYAEAVKETASASSTDTGLGEEVFSRGIAKLHLN